MNTIFFEKKNTLVIAHRGLSGLEKENTMAAFIAAGNRSYYGTECDIHLTKDKVFVVCHDFDTERVSGIKKTIKESDYVELSSISLFDTGTRISRPHLKIPTLSEYLAVSKKYQKHCVIEIKPLLSETEIVKLLEEVAQFDYTKQCIFISFTYENLVMIRKFDPNVRLQYLIGEYREDVLEKCLRINAGLDILYTNLNKDIIFLFHNSRLQVNAWTVNNPNEAQMLADWNVDFITTNILE